MRRELSVPSYLASWSKACIAALPVLTVMGTMGIGPGRWMRPTLWQRVEDAINRHCETSATTPTVEHWLQVFPMPHHVSIVTDRITFDRN